MTSKALGERWEVVRDRLLAESPETRREYERLGPRFELISKLIEARQKCGLTQREIAEAMEVSRPVVARLESAEHSPRFDTIVGYADALDCDLEVKLKPRRRGKAKA